ncbi:MAG: sigma-54 dependent transcriptional regulator [Vicinamibacterales bacterium]
MSDSTKHLLLVEDEAALREVIAEQLRDHGYQVEAVESGEAALARLADFAFDILVTDLRLPGIDGARLIEDALERYPDLIVIVISGYGTVKAAVDAIKRGAWDFVSKPFQIDELLLALKAALEQRRLKSENAYLRAQLDERHRFEGIIGKSPAMQRLFQTLETVSATNSTVLITGETGTGKEVAARAIHHNGPRRAQRFVAINCGAIPETLLEAELFGHVRGAFTGAIGNREGRFEQAHRGTLFLDEVGTMSAALQIKLLRALQEREFERIGDSRTTKVDVRVIAATNSDLSRLVIEGTFREDLYYRLNVISVELPPLRERRDDIPLLTQHFVDKLRGERAAFTVSQDAMRRLMSFPWPGNVRQLENAIERAMAFTAPGGQIDVSALPPEIGTAADTARPHVLTLPEGVALESFVRGIERTLVEHALAQAGGNKGKAAQLLHMKRTTLVERLKRLSKT